MPMKCLNLPFSLIYRPIFNPADDNKQTLTLRLNYFIQTIVSIYIFTYICSNISLDIKNGDLTMLISEGGITNNQKRFNNYCSYGQKVFDAYFCALPIVSG